MVVSKAVARANFLKNNSVFKDIFEVLNNSIIIDSELGYTYTELDYTLPDNFNKPDNFDDILLSEIAKGGYTNTQIEVIGNYVTFYLEF